MPYLPVNCCRSLMLSVVLLCVPLLAKEVLVHFLPFAYQMLKMKGKLFREWFQLFILFLINASGKSQLVEKNESQDVVHILNFYKSYYGLLTNLLCPIILEYFQILFLILKMSLTSGKHVYFYFVKENWRITVLK